MTGLLPAWKLTSERTHIEHEGNGSRKAMGAMSLLRSQNPPAALPGDRAQGLSPVLSQVQAGEHHQREKFHHQNNHRQTLRHSADRKNRSCSAFSFGSVQIRRPAEPRRAERKPYHEALFGKHRHSGNHADSPGPAGMDWLLGVAPRSNRLLGPQKRRAAGLRPCRLLPRCGAGRLGQNHPARR